VALVQRELSEAAVPCAGAKLAARRQVQGVDPEKTMCSHYQAAKAAAKLARQFPDAVWPALAPLKDDMWPRYQGLFVRRPPERDSGDEAVPPLEGEVGRWGLIPAGMRAHNPKLSTFNARSETADKSFTFGHAWRKGQRCIIPAEAFFEPDWRSGRAVPTRFSHVDGEVLGIAGLWDRWRSPDGETVLSFTMLTINADTHALMKDFHRPDKERRMVVVLPLAAYDDWLDAPVERIMDFMHPYPAERLVATAEAARKAAEPAAGLEPELDL
jgi:putative SOS response-associated peptidase YedK